MTVILLRSVLLALTLQLLLARPSTAQESEAIELPRIGKHIDSLDREYFGLFPRVDDFVSAVVRLEDDGSAVAIIRHAHGGDDTSLPISQQQLESLRRYLDEYEAIFEGSAKELDWNTMRELVRPAQPIGKEAVIFEVDIRANETYRGRLLYATERRVIIALGDDEVDWRHPERRALVFDVTAIDRLRDDASFISAAGSKVDVPIRGNDSMYRGHAFAALKSLLPYNGAAPPELAALLDTATPIASHDAAMSMQAIMEGLRPRRISLGVAFGLHAWQNEFSVVPTDRSAFSVQAPGHPFLSVGAWYDLLRWLRVGVGGRLMATQVPIESHQYEIVSGTVYRGEVMVLVARRSELLIKALSRIDVGISAFVEYGTYSVDTKLGLAGNDWAQYRTFERSGWSVNGGVSMQYYLSDLLSLAFDARTSFYPTFTIPGYQLRSKGNNVLLFRETTQHDYAMATTDMLLGLHIHL